MDPQPQPTQQNDDRSSEDFLPANLPRPVDDHNCDHLRAMDLPALPLRSTNNEEVDLSKLKGLTVVFCYPRTGKPKDPVPSDWDAIPGARGCTPQACSFKAATSELKSLGISNIFGLSTQPTEHQQLTRDHLNLGYHLLSDEHFKFCDALRLPLFEYGKWRLVKRVTLLIDDGKIVWVDYPVFPPDKSADKVVVFLKTQPVNTGRPGDGKDTKSLSPPSNDTPSDLPTATDRRLDDAGSSSPPKGATSLAPADGGLKKQGPASNFHPCQKWIEKKAREAAVATVAEKGQTSSNSVPEQGQSSSSSITGETVGPGKKYSFQFSGGCTAN